MATLRIDNLNYPQDKVLDYATFKVRHNSTANLAYGDMEIECLDEIIEYGEKETGHKITLISVGAYGYTKEDYAAIRKFCYENGIEYVVTTG